MNIFKILIIIMIIVSTLAFTQGCVDKTEKLPNETHNQTETVTEPTMEPVDEATTVNTNVNDTPAVVLPERKPETQIIWMQSYAFSPLDPVIYVGDTLNWINSERQPLSYKLVSEDGLWDNKTLGRGIKFSYTFTKAGVYNYSCPGYGNALKSSVTVLEYNETTSGLYDNTMNSIVEVD